MKSPNLTRLDVNFISVNFVYVHYSFVNMYRKTRMICHFIIEIYNMESCCMIVLIEEQVSQSVTILS